MGRGQFWIFLSRFSIARNVAPFSDLARRSAQISPAEQDKDNSKKSGFNLRLCSLWAGIVLLAAIWLGPLPDLARRAFFAHMLMHMGVVAVAAPLLSIGIAGGPFDLARKFPRVFAPIPASFLELVIVWMWHAPVLHHAARHDISAFIIEQAMFFAAGVFVWLAALGGDRLSMARRSAAGVVALLLTAMHMTLLGALLGLSPRPLYQHMERFSGLNALDDQHLGGAIMLLIGGISYLLGGLWLTIRLLRSRRVVWTESAA